MHGSKQRSVLITGCSSGIGRALASGLLAHGYLVIASARNDHDVDALRASGLPACQLDLTDPVSIASALQFTLEVTGGSLGVLINNAAYGQPGAVEDLPTDVLRRQFETNVFGTHELTRQVIPLMRQAGCGHIIQISSVLGVICLPYRGAYNASKFALEALTDTMRLELAGSGIQISLIEPGPVTSRFRENALAAFRATIDYRSSVHRAAYEREIVRLESDTPAPYTLPPEAVLEKVIHALEGRRPRLRYPVTLPAHVAALLRRLLSDRLLDSLLLRYSGQKS